MKYRFVTTTPDIKIIDEWESPSVSVKTPTANRKPEVTYEELLEQRDRLAEALELLVTTDHESKEAFIERVKQALAAVEGGSDE